MDFLDDRLPPRFWSKVDEHGPVSAHAPELGPCWMWIGATTKGYGRFRWDGRGQYAHRIALTIELGNLPSDLDVDHKCRTPRCCRPSHLEPVTRLVNLQRGAGHGGILNDPQLATRCKRGHEYTVGNTYHYLRTGKKRRSCRECLMENARAKRDRSAPNRRRRNRRRKR